MSPEQAARELDIDFTALLGAKVFPEFTARRAEIVIEPPYPDFGPDARYFAGFDYGMRSPAAFEVFTVQDGILYCVFEVYRPCRLISDFAEEMRSFPYWNNIRYIAADPNCWRLDQQSKGGLVSVESLFREAGVRTFVKGANHTGAEQAWVAMLREHWHVDAEMPGLRIFSSCSNLISEFETAIYHNQSERQLATQNYREEIADVRNHALDATKYLMLTRPDSKRPVQFEDPGLVQRWAQSSKSRARFPQGPKAPRPASGGVLKGYR